MSDLTRRFDALADSCGGYILGTGPRRGIDGKVLAHTDGGEWDAVRNLSRATVRRLVLWGMAGRVRPAGAVMPRGLRGVPTDPSTLAWAIDERGHARGIDVGNVVEWYVARCDAIAGEAASAAVLGDRPEPDPLPAWVDQWLARMCNTAKRTYAESCARSVYWGDDVWPAPPDTGAAWERKVWTKIGNRLAGRGGAR